MGKTTFEAVSDKVNNKNYDSIDENVLCWCKGDRLVTVNFVSGSRFYDRLKKLAAEREDVNIITDKLGVMVATIPIEFVKISPKKEMSEAAKKEAASRLKRYNKEHKKDLL